MAFSSGDVHRSARQMRMAAEVGCQEDFYGDYRRPSVRSKTRSQHVLVAAFPEHGVESITLLWACQAGGWCGDGKEIGKLELFAAKNEKLIFYHQRNPLDADTDGYSKNSSGEIDRPALDKRIANEAYGLRNGNLAPGDGWLYRGRGLKQVTGKNNYKQLMTEYRWYWNSIDRDFEASPELLTQAVYGVRSAIWFWISNICMRAADKGIAEGKIDSVTAIVNRGELGKANADDTFKLAPGSSPAIAEDTRNQVLKLFRKEKPMKNAFISIFCLLTMTFAQAQLLLKQDVSPRQAKKFVRSIPASEFDPYIQIHGVTEIDENGKPHATGLTSVTSQTEYKWALRNINFYSYIKAFRTNLTLPPICISSSGEAELWRTGCNRAVSNFVQCHLLLISPSKKLIAVQPLHIPQPDFIEAKPGCFDVYAMAPAKVVKDGMLIVAGYYDSRWTCNSGWYCASNSPAASPDPLYKTTFLVRFSEDEQGKLTLSQDDKCMPPLNKYDTIAKARNALREKGCT